MDVMNGNPGAFTIIRTLMAYPTWHQLLHHLKTHGLVGSELWRVIKDDYGHDVTQFVEDQLAEMAPKRARTLRALGRRVVPHSN
jgi:hypothetical protein